MAPAPRRTVSAERGHPVSDWLYAHTARFTEAGPLGRHRAELVARARGVTLDLGAGTGLNLAHLSPAVTDLHLVEPDPHMRSRLAQVVPLSAVVHAVGGEDMPLPTASVDTVLMTLTMCSVDDLDAVAHEVRRVLRPDGQVVVLEHVRSDDAGTARWQRRLDPVYTRLAGGCHLDRDTGRALQQAGLDTAALRETDVAGASLTRRLLMGVAVVG